MTVAELAAAAKKASFALQSYTTDEKNEILFAIAEGILSHVDEILQANACDLDNFADKESAFFDRLKLTPVRIDGMVEGIKQIAYLKDPVGEVTAEWDRPSGISLKKVRAPLGVVAIIYEARPNVTVDAAALCVKSGNVAFLRGSKGAINSNRVLYKIMREAVENAGFNPDVILFVDDEGRDAVKELLQQNDYIDLVIPRGGESLKHFILENSKIPVLASAGGNCHIYVEKSANLEKALDVIKNAKCQRPSTCNAVEHILVDDEIAVSFIPELIKLCADNGVEIKGDERACSACESLTLASDVDFDTEFCALTLTVKVVDNVYCAIDEINKRGTRHSEAILSENKEAIDAFVSGVDAAAVYVNASTRFTDGFEFGFGAEMGISTGKMHARGPIGLEQLTCERYIVTGDYSLRK